MLDITILQPTTACVTQKNFPEAYAITYWAHSWG